MMIHIVFLLGTLAIAHGGKVSIQGNKFYVNGQETFMSGANLAWVSYGYDFGNNQWTNYPKGEYKKDIEALSAAGGNSLRVWVHIQAEVSPAYDSNGYTTGLDKQGTFLSDFTEMLDIAQANNILIIPTLWNAAVDNDASGYLSGLFKEEDKLQSYIDNALKPWVNVVKDHPAVGMWDIINEPEGMLIPNQQNSEPCYDTSALKDSGAGWAGEKYTIEEILKFLNWQTAAIKEVDPSALVSVGVWNPKSNIVLGGYINHYTDECLIKAGGKALGVMDYWQFHSYSWNTKFDDIAPFLHDAADYMADKPIIIGEFYEQQGGGMTTVEMFDYVYNHGYQGAWSWRIHLYTQQREGIAHIAGYTSNGVIPIDLSQ